jgi:hypothetical protein
MFEKPHSSSAASRGPNPGLQAEGGVRGRSLGAAADAGRIESRSARRAGDALRAVEWSEITARLKAARDLRLLLRDESHAPIEAVAASFGDAAASYFALIDDGERNINPDGLGQSKVFGVMVEGREANRSGDVASQNAGAAPGDAREMQ